MVKHKPVQANCDYRITDTNALTCSNPSNPNLIFPYHHFKNSTKTKENLISISSIQQQLNSCQSLIFDKG